MRIAINTRLLIPGKMDGIGWFTAETVSRMAQWHPEHEFYFFFDRKPHPSTLYAPNVHPVVLHPPARHPILWYLFFQWSVRKALQRYKIDLFLSPDGWMALDTPVPTLTVIHDLNFEHATDNLKPSHQRYMTCFFPQFARYATRIATVSEFSKHDIVETYHIAPEKIDVVYDGSQAHYHPHTDSEKEATRRLFTNGCRYFIFISTILKRKNLANLLLAFDEFKKHDTQQHRLVVVGARVWWQDELKSAFDNMQHQDDVVFIGRAEPQQLAALLSAAEALVYPSFFEGFGIPIIEAFHAETPVITSNVTSMPEVAGDAAILVDPHSPQQIATALQRIASEPQLRATLIAKGRQQRNKFSWDLTAERLWQSLMNTKP